VQPGGQPRIGVQARQAAQAQTAGDPLKALVAFSSVAGRFGNVGQVDYAMANEAMTRILAREKALSEVEGYAGEYRALSGQIETNQAEMRALLDGAEMPLEGLSVDAGVLTYKGKAWDCMGDSERLRVATSIVRKVNPACGFVLLDGLERMDIPTLESFGQWLQEQGLQVLGTKVSSGPECSIIIEDGRVTGAKDEDEEISFG
jgi:hypothetical protein